MVVGAIVGVLSTTLTWITSDEIVKMRLESGETHSFPGSTVPDLNIAGLCDTGWISSEETLFGLAAFLFVIGAVLAFYTSLGVIAQAVGFALYYRAFEFSNAAVISGMPSGFGPKLALISILLVAAGTVYPLYVWRKAKLTGIWRRFITVAPEKDVRQLFPIMYAVIGGAIAFWGQVVWSSSRYDDATLSAVLFTVAGFVMLAIAMFAMVLPWKSD